MKISKRKAVWASLIVGVVAAATASLVPTVSFAHGALLTPGSRTYLCYKDALVSTGEIRPTNAACNNALAVGGAQPFYDWFGVLRSDGAGRTRGFIPDGALCSGGFTKYAGFDAPRSDWPLTHLTSGASHNFSYAAWAAHPGWFYLYVTKDGFNPNQALTWNDMEEQPFLSVDHPPLNGSAPSGNYYWTGNLPSGKSGRHIIYSVWKRSDSNETFYGCSDVVFDGGHGEVTGINNSDPLPSASPSTTSPSPSVSPSRSTSPSPSPSRSTSPSPSASTPPPTGACSATYAITGTWSGGFQGEVTVKNNSTTAQLNGWTAKWTFANGQVISQIWSGTLTASGANITVKPVNYNTTIPASGSTVFGFLASQNGTNAIPTVTCTSP